MGAAGRNRTIIHVGPAPAPEPKERPRDQSGDDTAEHSAPPASRTASSAPKRFSPGETVPGTRYRICRFIGDGGMGAVYEAEHVDLERRVALKILLPQLSASPSAVEMFRKEARTATKVGSDHIVELYDFAELPDGRVLFTMELLSGPTLNEVIHREQLSSARALAVLRQVCKGLSAAHAAGVVHRDIKPENIVLERHKGRADWVKILDFGISEILTDKPAQGVLTAGTPMYLAPELIEGKPYDHRADIYALGCLAYEMVTGRPPFLGKPEGDVASVLQQHLEQQPELPSKRARSPIPDSLDNVIMRCLAKSPHQRYPTVDALEAGLCEAQIEGKLTTTWDDLPLPERVDPALRDRLLRDMPDPDLAGVRRTPGWLWPTVAGLCLIVGAGAAVFFAGGLSSFQSEPTEDIANAAAAPEEVTPVDALVDEALAAAAKSYFVYPPADDASHPTAYTKIVELEAMEGEYEPLARRRALQLRREFADTLTKLGDAYWGNEDGKTFAVDFYRQALVFDRTSAVASSRAALTPTDLDVLENKARQLEFSEEEIIEAESLAVLAEPDKEKRKRKIARLRARRKAASADENAATDKLLAVASSDVAVPTRPTSSAARPVRPDPDLEGRELFDAEVVDEEIIEEEPEPEPKPEPVDPAAASSATDLAKSARKLMKQGDKEQARTFFERALIFDPGNAAALLGMFDLSMGKGAKNEALQYAERLARAHPDNPKHHLRVGDLRFEMGLLQAALTSYRKAEELGSKKAGTKVAKLEKELGIEDEPEVAEAEEGVAESPEESKPPAVADESEAPAPSNTPATGEPEPKPDAKKSAEPAAAPAAVEGDAAPEQPVQ